MDPDAAPGEHGAGLSRPIAHGDDDIERLTDEAIERLARRRGPIDADLGEDAHRVGFTPFGSVPADSTVKRPPPRRCRSASAIWLRVELPLQTKRTRVGATAPSSRVASIMRRAGRPG